MNDIGTYLSILDFLNLLKAVSLISASLISNLAAKLTKKFRKEK